MSTNDLNITADEGKLLVILFKKGFDQYTCFGIYMNQERFFVIGTSGRFPMIINRSFFLRKKFVDYYPSSRLVLFVPHIMIMCVRVLGLIEGNPAQLSQSSVESPPTQ